MTSDLDAYAEFIDAASSNVATFLKPHIGNIDQLYNWPFNEDKAKSFLGKNVFDGKTTNYQKTIALKKEIVCRIKNEHDFAGRFSYAEYFVKDWGGVSTNKSLKSVLEPYDSVSDLNTIKTFKGVSSWSKYLSIVHENAHIYDSRIAFALNTLNFLKRNAKYFFPMPGGRSPKLNLISIETLFGLEKLKNIKGFLSEDDLNHRQVASRFKMTFYLPETQVYRLYLRLLAKASKLLRSSEQDVEMLLFALASTTIFNSLIKYFMEGTNES